MAAATEFLVWIDCEMTGLDPQRDELVEIAVIVTDFELRPLDEGLEVVIAASPAAMDGMSDFVRSMHAGSGLLPEIAKGVAVDEAERHVLAYIDRFVPKDKRPPLAGNTIGTDRAFIARYMPALDTRLHYRNVDVSSIKELSRRWFPAVYSGAPAKNGGHRALADIRESIRELAYYRRVAFVAPPGPDKAAITEAAEAAVAAYESAPTA